MSSITVTGPIGAAFIAVLTLSPAGCAEQEIEAEGKRIQHSTVGSELGEKSSYTLFEAGQVRPLALSPDGTRLFAVNTPDNRLEVFRPRNGGLDYCGSVPVGVEPVAVAARSNREAWVVNHVSDSVSIVAVSRLCASRGWGKHIAQARVGRVTRTLLVADEPRDIVFGGADRSRAFITTAHRGQNAPYDPQLTTPSVGRADVWVFDANNLGDAMGGTPLTIVQLFSDTPRALEVSADGSRVYAAGFKTGNRTTTVFHDRVALGGGLPAPLDNHAGHIQPLTGLIVGYDGANWVDNVGRTWDYHVRFNLPDKDVFVIDANANPPAQLAGAGGYYQGVGTVLFNMAVNPANGKIYVSNTDANNRTRFEGAGIHGGSTVRGDMVRSRITVLETDSVIPIDLNKHVDPSECCDPIPNEVGERSLAFPMGMAVSADGATLYTTAFGSSKVGVFDTSALENDTFEPSSDDHIELSGGGPSGIVLDERRDRAYVLTRFDNGISIIDLDEQQEVAHIAMHNPEPASVTEGRRFQYDARLSSSNGTQACASCHIFGDMDQLAWDLGDPDHDEAINPGPFALHPLQAGSSQNPNFAPMKGPMTTQSLRGMANHGPMHWRGDRTGGLDEPSAQPNAGSFDEQAAFKAFNPAFVGLNGRPTELTEEQMQAYTNFALQITYPPNPVRNLDNSLTTDQQAGRDHYFSAVPSDTFFNCNGCHTLDPDGNAEYGIYRPGFFGTDGRYSFENIPQVFKVAHLRNMYQKVGMFGMAENREILPENFDGTPNAHTGDQIRGFGFLHDGSVDTLERFLSALLFVQRAPGTRGPTDPGNPGGFGLDAAGVMLRRQVVAFVLAFDSNLAPVVGQQVTLTRDNGDAVGPRIDLLIQRAEANECDLIAYRNGRGYLYRDGKFHGDRSFGRALTDAGLRRRARYWRSEITYTCAPPGSGARMAIDRDEDGYLDGDERFAGSDPADAESHPWWASY